MRKSLSVAVILLVLGSSYVDAQKIPPPLIRQVIGSKQRASNPATSFRKMTLPGSSILVGVVEQNRGIAATSRIEDTQDNSYMLVKMSPYVDRKSEWCAIYLSRKIKGGLDEVRAQFSFLPDGKRVSTVWLGLDHGYFSFLAEEEPYYRSPLIFETMVFSELLTWMALGTFTTGYFGHEILDQDRYSTEAEAKEGHDRMCRKWRMTPALKEGA